MDFMSFSLAKVHFDAFHVTGSRGSILQVQVYDYDLFLFFDSVMGKREAGFTIHVRYSQIPLNSISYDQRHRIEHEINVLASSISKAIRNSNAHWSIESLIEPHPIVIWEKYCKYGKFPDPEGFCATDLPHFLRTNPVRVVHTGNGLELESSNYEADTLRRELFRFDLDWGTNILVRRRENYIDIWDGEEWKEEFVIIGE